MTHTLTMTKAEARYCRDAVKAFGPEGFLLPKAGDNELSRGDWYDLHRWLQWCSTDMDTKCWLEKRKAMWALAERIEAFVDVFGPEVREPDPVKIERQMDLFAGLEI